MKQSTKEFFEANDLQVIHPEFAFYDHWTGLIVDSFRSEEEVKQQIEKAIIFFSPEEAVRRKERWARLKEALQWQKDFWIWFGERTCPRKYRYEKDLTVEKEKVMRIEHEKLASEYIRDYKPFNVVSPHQFTDKVPAEMRRCYKENLELIEEVKKDSWRWEERFPEEKLIDWQSPPPIPQLALEDLRRLREKLWEKMYYGTFPVEKPYGQCSSCGEALPPPSSAVHRCNWKTMIAKVPVQSIPKDQEEEIKEFQSLMNQWFDKVSGENDD